MDGLLVQVEELGNTAKILRKENTKQQECLRRIHRQMQTITREWQSPSAQTIYQQFQKLLPIFKQYEQVVEQYATFLDTTVASYQDMEQELNQYAQMFGR